MINHVEEILNRSRDIHLKKREDYATNPTADPFENFDRSAEIARWFPATYSSFAVLIGTKLARLGSLLVTGKTPNNESIDDTFLDLITYCALFYAYWKSKQIIKSPHPCGFSHDFNIDGICRDCGTPYADYVIQS
jgi:hypothetical protein